MKFASMRNIILSVVAMGMHPFLPAYAQDSYLPFSSADLFPRLPLSKICTKDKLVGIWKLLMVYEVPAGNELALYNKRPLQYFVFEADNRYGDFVSSLRAVSQKDVRSFALNNPKVLQQYVVNKFGILFFYKDGIAVDSLACFVVASSDGPFQEGQMLLMPPENVAHGRMVKVYQKMPLEIE